MMRRFLISVIVGSILLSFAAQADDLADGLQAFDGGDYAEARAAWERAAAGGNTLAMTSLANLYTQGQGVRRDPGMAFSWYKRAAEHGDAVGQMNLGELYAARDPVTAYFWLSLAANQGNGWAATRLKDIAKTLDADQIAKSNALIKAWKPKAN